MSWQCIPILADAVEATWCQVATITLILTFLPSLIASTFSKTVFAITTRKLYQLDSVVSPNLIALQASVSIFFDARKVQTLPTHPPSHVQDPSSSHSPCPLSAPAASLRFSTEYTTHIASQKGSLAPVTCKASHLLRGIGWSSRFPPNPARKHKSRPFGSQPALSMDCMRCTARSSTSCSRSTCPA